MRYIIYSALVLMLSVAFVNMAHGQKKENFDIQAIEINHEHTIHCPHSGLTEPGYAPIEFKSKLGQKSANVIFIYSTEPGEITPENFKPAIEYAGDVLAEIISSPIDIRVFVRTEDTGDVNNLAAAGPWTFQQAVQGDYDNLPLRDTWYPVALVEKLERININGTAPDINVTINSTQENWQLTPNSPNTIGNKSDLATVLVHELLHGIGFTGGSGLNGSIGTYIDNLTFGQSPNTTTFSGVHVYDRYLESADNRSLVDDFDNASSDLGEQLNSNNLFFNSPFFDVNNNRPKVNAPSLYARGSSIYHLDAQTYNFTEHRLMRPSISGGDIRYEPGSIARNMLDDMGWSSIYFDVTAEQFTEDVTTDFVTKLFVESDSGLDTASLELHYSTDAFQTEDLTVGLTVVNDTFVGVIPAPNTAVTYSYYFTATDGRGFAKQYPGTTLDQSAAPFYFTNTYGPDMTIPTLEHDAISRLTDLDNSITLIAEAADVFPGIDVVKGVVQVNTGTLDTFDLVLTDNGFDEFYQGTYVFPNGLQGDDEVKYSLFAFDQATNPNKGIFPVDGSTINLTVESVPQPQMMYTNDFDDLDGSDFVGDGWSVNKPATLEDGVMSNTTHPYRTAGENNTLDFIYQLNNAIIVAAENDFIKFDEIVLVEPGELGAAFGTTEFWDYVIVETRKVGQTNWTGLSDGYDCGQQVIWRNRYNSAIVNGVSSATPTESLFREKSFDFSRDGGYSAGDTIQIRFRLFSDPFAAGWGWAIDNLNIQDANTNVDVDEFIEENAFEVYPNPSNTGMINVAASFTKGTVNLRTELTDMYGRLIQVQRIPDGSTEYIDQMDISQLPAGIYLMTLRDNESAIVKKVVKY